MNLFNELKRRNVFRVAGVYAVVGWLLMQLAGSLESALNLPAWFDSVVTAGLIIGFPLAILLAWAFEVTPEGVRRTVEGEEEIESSKQWFEVSVVIGLLIVIGLSLSQYLKLPNVTEITTSENSAEGITKATGLISATNEIPDNSIAVLPFADLSKAGDQEYFSDGVAEEILNVLVRVDALKVTSRTSAFQFKGSNKGIPEIAEQLKVRYVLEGSLRKSGETLRITAQLIDAQNDKHLWSNTFDRPLTTENIFAIQDEIANSILLALGEHLDLPSKIKVSQSTTNLTAYELYLKAKPLFLFRRDLDVADQFLEQATNLDPKFAKAWEIRAALQSLMVSYNYTNKTYEQQHKRLFEFANKAISLEPNSALAIASKGLAMADQIFKMAGIVDMNQILDDYNAALKIEPKNASAHNWKGLLLHYGGFLEQARASFQSCLDQEPFYAPCSENMEIVLAELGRDKESIDLYLSSLNRGNRKTSGPPALAAMARLDMEIVFKTSTNHKKLLSGWPKHDELYQAFKKPNDDHSELLKDIEEYLINKNTIIQDIDIMLNPLGRIPADNTLGIWDATNHNGRQSLGFKSFIRNSGIYRFWLAGGFPPQCKPLGVDGFVCD